MIATDSTHTSSLVPLKPKRMQGRCLFSKVQISESPATANTDGVRKDEDWVGRPLASWRYPFSASVSIHAFTLAKASEFSFRWYLPELARSGMLTKSSASEFVCFEMADSSFVMSCCSENDIKNGSVLSNLETSSDAENVAI